MFAALQARVAELGNTQDIAGGVCNRLFQQQQDSRVGRACSTEICTRVLKHARACVRTRMESRVSATRGLCDLKLPIVGLCVMKHYLSLGASVPYASAARCRSSRLRLHFAVRKGVIASEPECRSERLSGLKTLILEPEPPGLVNLRCPCQGKSPSPSLSQYVCVCDVRAPLSPPPPPPPAAHKPPRHSDGCAVVCYRLTFACFRHH